MKGSLKISLGILGAAVLIGGGLMTGHFWPKDPQETASKPRYRATTVFQIHQNSAPDISTLGSGGTNWFEAQVKSLTARDTLMLAVQNLKLETEWKLLPEEAASKLERLTEVEHERGTDIVSLSAWSDSAEEADTIANGVRDAYAQRRKEMEAERARRLTKTVVSQTKLQEAAVEKSRLEMLELMKKHNIVELTSEPPNAANFPEPGEIDETPELPSETEPSDIASQRQKQSEYATGKYRYDSQVQLLNSMREHASKFTQEPVTRNFIEILKPAVAVKDP